MDEEFTSDDMNCASEILETLMPFMDATLKAPSDALVIAAAVVGPTPDTRRELKGPCAVIATLLMMEAKVRQETAAQLAQSC